MTPRYALASLFALGLVVAAGHASGSEPSMDVGSKLVFDEREGRQLVAVFPPARPDSSPDHVGGQLFESDSLGRLRPIANEVGLAAYAPEGAILFVQGDELYELADGKARLVASPVLADFAVDPKGRWLAVVRPDGEPESWIELIDRSGRHLATLSEPDGPNALPIFAPDGETLLFVSGRTGVYAIFRVEADGRGLRQLTNVGQRPGALRSGFAPPPNTRLGMRFVGNALEYDSGDALWRLDAQTGAAILYERKGGR